MTEPFLDGKLWPVLPDRQRGGLGLAGGAWMGPGPCRSRALALRLYHRKDPEPPLGLLPGPDGSTRTIVSMAVRAT